MVLIVLSNLLHAVFIFTGLGCGYYIVTASFLMRKLIKHYFNSIYKKLEPYQLSNPDWSYKYWLLLTYTCRLEERLKKHDPVYQQLGESEVAVMRKYNRDSNRGIKYMLISFVLLYVGKLIFGWQVK